jgi:hypothetical protein
MKSIDAEIHEVEQRLRLREAAVKGEARELKTRAARALMSPASIVAAVALGFVVAGAVGRRKARSGAPAVSKQTKEQGKGFAVGGLLMTAVTWFIKNQFGGPVGLAHFVASKVRQKQHRALPPARGR